MGDFLHRDDDQCAVGTRTVEPNVKRIRITDKPQKINLNNYQQKMRKLIVVLELAAQVLRDGLEEIEKEKKA